MKKLTLVLIAILVSTAVAQAKRPTSEKNQPIEYPRDSHHCAAYDCSDEPEVDPADDGFVPPFAGDNENDEGYEGDDSRDSGSDYIDGMPY